MEYSPKEPTTNFGILNVCDGGGGGRGVGTASDAGSAEAFSALLPQRVEWIRRSALSRYTVCQ
jgi:hypothetical protein